MTNIETIAAQRDALAARVRELGIKLAAATDEIARLKGSTAVRPPTPDLPQVKPPKAKHARILGGG